MKLQKKSLALWFVVLSAASILASVSVLFFSHGEAFSRLFFLDIRDTGMDFFHSIEYLKGNREADFDVYRATSMAATAIQAWRSVLNGNASYPVPDFRKKADRLAYANDNLTPFVDDRGRGATLPQDSRMR